MPPTEALGRFLTDHLFELRQYRAKIGKEEVRELRGTTSVLPAIQPVPYEACVEVGEARIEGTQRLLAISPEGTPIRPAAYKRVGAGDGELLQHWEATRTLDVLKHSQGLPSLPMDESECL